MNIPFIGIRFFTVYGTWGRPDMFILKVLSYHNKRKKFNLNNEGNHLRDFTSINDVVKILMRIINKKTKKNDIYNICSNRPFLIKNVLINLEKKIGKINFKSINKNSADVLNTHGNNSKILKKYNLLKFSNFNKELNKIIEWYQTIKNKNYF